MTGIKLEMGKRYRDKISVAGLDAPETIVRKTKSGLFVSDMGHLYAEDGTCRTPFLAGYPDYNLIALAPDETPELIDYTVPLRDELAALRARVAELEASLARKTIECGEIAQAAKVNLDRTDAENARLREALGYCREIADALANAPIPLLMFKLKAVTVRECIDNALTAKEPAR